MIISNSIPNILSPFNYCIIYQYIKIFFWFDASIRKWQNDCYVTNWELLFLEELSLLKNKPINKSPSLLIFHPNCLFISWCVLWWRIYSSSCNHYKQIMQSSSSLPNKYYSALLTLCYLGRGSGAHREVILNSQIWKIWKWAQSYYLWGLEIFMIAFGLFHMVLVCIWEICYRKFWKALFKLLFFFLFFFGKYQV